MKTENLVLFAAVMVAASKVRIADMDAKWESRQKSGKPCDIQSRSGYAHAITAKEPRSVVPKGFVPTTANLVGRQ